MNRKGFKRILAGLLAVLVLITAFGIYPVSFAEEETSSETASPAAFAEPSSEYDQGSADQAENGEEAEGTGISQEETEAEQQETAGFETEEDISQERSGSGAGSETEKAVSDKEMTADVRSDRAGAAGIIEKTDADGNPYYISKTPNINENGNTSSYYASNLDLKDTIDLTGSCTTGVEIRYRTVSNTTDYLCILDGEGNVIKRDADGKQVGDSSGRIGGGSSGYTSAYTVSYRFGQETLQFQWHSDGSGGSYGYYAIITPVYDAAAVPAFHFEELEDGTYALVFDRGGDIDAFLTRSDIQEQIAPYKSKISEIRIHKDTTSIGKNAFQNLSSLKKITVPRNCGLETIGKNAFAGCDNLESITIPDTVTSINASAFSGCAALETVTFASGNAMTTLPDGLFKNLTSLKNVTLPNGLTEISADCFNGCTALKDIQIPSGVTKIQSRAFQNTRISEVPDLSGITEIGSQAFSDNPNLTNVTIPANGVVLGDAFRDCANIADFLFADGTNYETLPDGFFQGMSKLKNVKLPDGLKKISDEMFKGCSVLENVIFPDDVEAIGSNAFENCAKLQDFEIPSGVKSIGRYAFSNCGSLKDMVIPNTVTSLGTNLFQNCGELIRVRFEDGCRLGSLPGSMFYGCSKLETVKLPDGVTVIPANYFNGCSTLKHVDLPANLTMIGDYAFNGCTKLENPVFPSTLEKIGNYGFYNCDSITDLTIPGAVTSIGNNAFSDCDGITELLIPATVTSLGTSAFVNCRKLKNAEWETGSPMTSLNTSLFSGCTNLESLILPSGLTSIPDSLAQNCSRLSFVEIPSGVKTIGSYAFDGCKLLDDITIPDGCTNIKSYAFRNAGLTHIELPDSLTSIGQYAFSNTKVKNVIIPKNVTTISSNAFYSIPALETVVFEEDGKAVKVHTYSFANNPSLRSIITNGRIGANGSSSSNFIGSYAMQNDRKLEEFVIDPEVVNVRNGAFNNASGLKRLFLPASPQNTSLNIGYSSEGKTFGNLTSLEELFIDRNLTSSYKNTNEFININPDVHITIGKNVNTLDNMLVSVFSEDTEITFEGENDFSVTTRLPNTSSDKKWSELKGDFYVDPDGVVYKLNKSNNTASLFYIPKGITDYTVPNTITSVAGTDYQVTMVDSYAARSAEDLTTLVFENPSIVTIPEFAFTDAAALQTINGETELDPEDWARVSLLCDFPVHVQPSQSPEQKLILENNIPVVGDKDGKTFSFGVRIDNPPDDPVEMDENNPLTYLYPTGRSANLTIAINNSSNTIDMSDRVVRIYFAFSGENYTLGNYAPKKKGEEDYELENTATGVRYPFKVRATDAKGVYYYDITGFNKGDTLVFSNQFSYPTLSQDGGSGGGGMLVWIESLSSAEAEAREGMTSQPTDYIKANWYTKATPYRLEKKVAGNPPPEFVFTSNTADEEDDNIYVKNIQYQISLSSTGASGNTNAADYIRYVDLYDDMQLTEHMIWNPNVIRAVQDKEYYYSNNYLYVKLDGKWVELCHFSFPDALLVRSVEPIVVKDQNGNDAVRLCWSYKNTYWAGSSSLPTADLPRCDFYVYLGKQSIQVKEGSDLWRKFREGAEVSEDAYADMCVVSNKVHETSHYCFHPDQELVATAENNPVTSPFGFELNKTMTGNTYFGLEHGFDISLTNSGLVHNEGVDLIWDPLSEHYYIKPDDMETMFADSKWGPFLRIDMSSLTLCYRPDKEVVDVHGNPITITDAQYSGIDPIPYHGRALASEDRSEIMTSAKFSIYWDDSWTHKILEVKNDAEEILHSYTIGEECDYPSIDAAFQALGFIVTKRAKYTVTWDMDEKYILYQARKDNNPVTGKNQLLPEQIKKYEFLLKSGRTEVFHINSSVKRTDMFLEEDLPLYYSPSGFSSTNKAYIRDNGSSEVRTKEWHGTISPELSLGKSGSVNGEALPKNEWSVPDNTVIDYTLSFKNLGGTYEVLPLTDRMTGGQMLLIPVRTNQDALYYAEGSTDGIPLKDAGLAIHSESGIPYYILDKNGNYKNVLISGRIADTISVNKKEASVENEQTSVDTLMIWYYQNLEGNTGASTSTSQSITYKALVDNSRLGRQNTDENASTETTFPLSNETWLGGHQTHRLYDSMGGKSEQIQFAKWIVEDPESDREHLIRHSLIEDGDEVLYKMILRNTGKTDVTIRGSLIHDELPSTSGKFAWSKENVTDIWYVTEGLDSSVETTEPEYWNVSSIEPGTGADTAARGQYYIYWDNRFNLKINANGEAWIYIKLKFPSSAEENNHWDDYIAVNNGAELKNDFYVGTVSSTVTHEIVDVVEGILQKGVLDTGLSNSSNKYKSEGTRHYYQNGGNVDNGSVQEVAYYTVLYNSGNVRLYLDDLQDQLPKGFRFRGLINTIVKEAKTQEQYNAKANGTSASTSYSSLGRYNVVSTITNTENKTTDPSFYPVVTVNDTNRGSIAYKRARVQATVRTDEDGRDHVNFKIYNTGSGDTYLKYDSDLKKYYLNPGEAVRFGYICTVDGYANTENIANNEIAMPVYDKYGLGFHISDEEQVQVVPAQIGKSALNDGGCDLKTTEEEILGHRHKKPDWGRSTTGWLSSNVSLERLFAVPGVLKNVGGSTFYPPTETLEPDQVYGSKYSDSSKTGSKYTGTVQKTSIVNWMIRAFNEGGNSMEDYTIVDTVDAPYMFTGNFFYDCYSLNNEKMTSASVPIFSLGARSKNDTTVRISTGQGSSTLTLDGTITVNGGPVSVDGGRATVRLLRDENGVETIKIHLKDNYHRIPANTYLALIGHTQYVSNSVVLSEQYYNHVQLEPSGEFDPAMVSQGKVLYQDREGEHIPYAIESGASVTMTAGYSTAARKQVTELGNPTNTGWSDRDTNSIVLPDKSNKFSYDLYVDLPEEEPTKKYVLIDSLPEEGDHSLFVERDHRDSEFKVRFLASNFRFSVKVCSKEGTETELSPSQYRLEVTPGNTFSAEDWKGNGEDWNLIDLSDGIGTDEETLLQTARSFRIVIDDAELAEHPLTPLLPKGSCVQIHFNAEIENPAEADPGEIAWNSFGYTYTVLVSGTDWETSLSAEPLKVGVQVPAVPYVIKDQKTPHDHYKAIDRETEYQFLIYSGAALPALNDTSQMTQAEIADILSAGSRTFTITSFTVGTGKSTNRSAFMDAQKEWAYDSGTGAFIKTGNSWIWNKNAQYTVIELPWVENGFRFSDIQHSPVNNYTFIQNTENNVVLRVTNVFKEKGNLKLQKTVAGPNFDPERKFTFTIELKDGKYPAYGSYDYKGENIRDGSLMFDDTGTASIQLKHGQAIELQGIPEGYTYKITESEDEWYVPENSGNTEGVIEKDVTTVVNFTNTRKSSSLEITKTVSGILGNTTKLFDFEIYIVDEGKELSGDYSAVLHHADGSEETRTVSFAEGAAVIQLKHGDRVVFPELPFGAHYELGELAASRKGYSQEATNTSGNLGDTPVVSDWINSKGGMVPTGGLEFAFPGLLFLGGIGVLAFLFFRLKGKRKS